MKKKLLTIFKLLVSVNILFWLIKTDQINFAVIESALTNKKLFFIFITLSILQLFISSIRTNILMLFKTKKNISKIFRLTWSASFINSITPSSLFGEVFKLKKLFDLDTDIAKDNAIYNSLFSKIFTSLAVITVTLTSALFLKELPDDLLGIFMIQGILLFFLILPLIFKNTARSFAYKVYKSLQRKTKRKFLINRIENLKLYYKTLFFTKNKVFHVFVLSIALNILRVSAYYFIITSINPSLHLSIINLLTVIPTGIFITMLPISISGLGVGHIAFAKLLEIHGIESGVDVFSVFFVYSYICNILGLIPLLFDHFRNKLFKI